MARPWVVNAVMTSGTVTPASNYRTETITLQSQWHAHTCTSAHAWSLGGRRWEASTPSTYPSGRCNLQYLSLCTCRDSDVKEIQGKRNQSLKKKKNKINTKCTKSLILLFGSFRSSIILETERNVICWLEHRSELKLPLRYKARKHGNSNGNFTCFCG